MHDHMVLEVRLPAFNKKGPRLCRARLGPEWPRGLLLLVCLPASLPALFTSSLTLPPAPCSCSVRRRSPAPSALCCGTTSEGWGAPLAGEGGRLPAALVGCLQVPAALPPNPRRTDACWGARAPSEALVVEAGRLPTLTQGRPLRRLPLLLPGAFPAGRTCWGAMTCVMHLMWWSGPPPGCPALTSTWQSLGKSSDAAALHLWPGPGMFCSHGSGSSAGLPVVSACGRGPRGLCACLQACDTHALPPCITPHHPASPLLPSTPSPPCRRYSWGSCVAAHALSHPSVAAYVGVSVPLGGLAWMLQTKRHFGEVCRASHLPRLLLLGDQVGARSSSLAPLHSCCASRWGAVVLAGEAVLARVHRLGEAPLPWTCLTPTVCIYCATLL